MANDGRVTARPASLFDLLDRPFVLFDDAREGGSATLLAGPAEVIEARRPDEVAFALEQLRAERGREAAGFIAYEAGRAMTPQLAALARTPISTSGAEAEPPLLWFGLFDGAERVDAAGLLPDPAGAWCGRPQPQLEEQVFVGAVDRLRAHIVAGDIGHVTHMVAAGVKTAGHPLAVYAALRGRAPTGYGALVWTGAHWLMSFSPILFFRLKDKRVMTGRAEADAGAAPAAESAADVVEAIRTLFPPAATSGSPKVRAIEVLAEEGMEPRGVYGGAIGRVDAGGNAGFSVAVRTLVLRAGDSVARLGLGARVTADSRAPDLWRAALSEGGFVTTQRGFDLVETMRHDPEESIALLDRHLARMTRSAAALGFAFDRHRARNELQAATFGRGPSVVRLLLGRSGAMAVEVRPLPPGPLEPVPVALAPVPVSPHDFRLRHVTSDRAFYRDALRGSRAFEVAFVQNERWLTEGSFTTLFVPRGGLLLTPPLERGLRPGVLREELIDQGRAEEADLTARDLASGFMIGNSVRGLMRAMLNAPL